jgi:hypothetical protein
MNQNRREFCLPARFTEEIDGFFGKRLGQPAARIAREDLDSIAACVSRNHQRLMQAAFDRRMEPDARSS